MRAAFIFHLLALYLLHLNEWNVMCFFSTVFSSSHDFIGEFTTSYKELCRGQSQLNVFEVIVSLRFL